MTSNMKAVLIVIGSVLVIFGGEVVKQSLTDWVQITTLPFIAGMAIQVGGLFGAIAGGVSFDVTKRTTLPTK